MYRRRLMFLTGLLCVLAAILPFAGVTSYAWLRANMAERHHRIDYSQATLRHAAGHMRDTLSVFRTLEAENWKPCSPRHIARMRQLTIDTRAVDEIGFYIGDRLACTSWGPVRTFIARGHPDARLSDGVGLYLDVKPKVTGGKPTLVFSHENYNLLMRPERLINVVTDTPMTLGLATLDGKLIAINAEDHETLIDRILRDGGCGRSGALYYGSSKDRNYRAFIITDQALITHRIIRDLRYLLPLGGLLSCLLVFLVIWLSRRKLTLEHEIAAAMRRNEFRVSYQPIIELATNRCTGAEALLRWDRWDGTDVSPDLFIPLAEQHGLIEPLTDFMIQRVVADLAEMLRREDEVHIAINISSTDMQSGRFLSILEAALAQNKVSPKQIWLEATERGFMDPDAARSTLEIARSRGHLVAIDDFGTGYSSLSLLEKLPLDALKIDKSFVEAIGRSAATSSVTPHIIDMAHGLKLTIVAEGVETADQADYLRGAGVEFAQGWLFAPALSALEFLDYFAKANARHASMCEGQCPS